MTAIDDTRTRIGFDGHRSDDSILGKAYASLTGPERGRIETWAQANEQLEAALMCALPDRRRIIGQAELVLGKLYVHLAQKQSTNGIDPLAQLQSLRRDVEQDTHMCARTFHSRMIRIFRSLRDPHTMYDLPEAYTKRTAFLPFLVEVYFDEISDTAPAAPRENRARFIVSRLLGDAIERTGARQSEDGLFGGKFSPGAEITHWNGTPIRQAMMAFVERENGSNPASRFSLAVAHMTVRPLADYLLPKEELVIVRFKPEPASEQDAPQAEMLFPWRVWIPNTAVGPARDEIFLRKSLVSLNRSCLRLHESRKTLYRSGPLPERDPVIRSEPRGKEIGEDVPVPDGLAGAIEIRKYLFPDGTSTYPEEISCGYVRIRHFVHLDHETTLRDVAQILERKLPADGLIIDVRGNTGGDIPTAEALLQFLTPEPLRRARFQIRANELTRSLCGCPQRDNTDAENGKRKKTDFDERLESWHDSVDTSVRTGADKYSAAQFLTEFGHKSPRGQYYFGPVLLVTDALTYSAGDIFAAGFKDNEVGHTIGLDERTGAGGASLMDHHTLRAVVPGQLEEIPNEIDIDFAFSRSLRAGTTNEGQILEDIGAVADHAYETTKRDLLHGNLDLIRTCAELLRREANERAPCFIRLESDPLHDHRTKIMTCPFEVMGIKTLSVWLSNQHSVQHTVNELPKNLELEVAPDCGQFFPDLIVRGFRSDGSLAANRIVRLEHFRRGGMMSEVHNVKVELDSGS